MLLPFVHLQGDMIISILNMKNWIIESWVISQKWQKFQTFEVLNPNLLGTNPLTTESSDYSLRNKLSSLMNETDMEVTVIPM